MQILFNFHIQIYVCVWFKSIFICICSPCMCCFIHLKLMLHYSVFSVFSQVWLCAQVCSPPGSLAAEANYSMPACGHLLEHPRSCWGLADRAAKGFGPAGWSLPWPMLSELICFVMFHVSSIMSGFPLAVPSCAITALPGAPMHALWMLPRCFIFDMLQCSYIRMWYLLIWYFCNILRHEHAITCCFVAGWWGPLEDAACSWWWTCDSDQAQITYAVPHDLWPRSLGLCCEPLDGVHMEGWGLHWKNDENGQIRSSACSDDTAHWILCCKAETHPELSCYLWCFCCLSCAILCCDWNWTLRRVTKRRGRGRELVILFLFRLMLCFVVTGTGICDGLPRAGEGDSYCASISLFVF